jgi:hypothetical protein
MPGLSLRPHDQRQTIAEATFSPAIDNTSWSIMRKSNSFSPKARCCRVQGVMLSHNIVARVVPNHAVYEYLEVHGGQFFHAPMTEIPNHVLPKHFLP